MLGSALLALTLAASPAPATAHGARGCAERVEPAAPDAARVTAPVRFFTAGSDRLPARDLRGRDGRFPSAKVPVDVRAGTVVTVRVAPESRGRVALDFVRRPGPRLRPLTAGQRAVTFTACAADEPAFGGRGVVGPRTGFSGGLIVDGVQCAHLTARVRGEDRVRRLRVGLGRACDR